ncbi:hypothetical protein LXL04_013364 [Taraxacum kok-saghyz]
MDLPPQPTPQPPPSNTIVKTNGKLPATQVTNGVLRRHRRPPPVMVSYGRCLKNHAASNGGHVLDGCGDYMPSSIPTSLECDVCGCHRNFHHIEVDHSRQPIPQVVECQCNQQHHHHHRHPPPTPPPSCLATMAKSSNTPNSQSPPPISSSYYPAAPHMFLTLNTSLPPTEQTNNKHPMILTPAVATGSNLKGKKRFRTKFSEYQKEKMQEFAERIGWKMLKIEEEMIVGFCKQIGVTKNVFKVWMHNHKSSSNPGNKRNNHQDHTTNVIGVNGSSSSS